MRAVRIALLLCACQFAGGAITSEAWAIVPGRTDKFSDANWNGTNWTTGTDWSAPNSFANTNVYQWSNGSAVAISPFWMLTARHVGGSAGNTTVINGATYTCVEARGAPKDSGQSVPPDLWLVKLDAPLPGYETLYNGSVTNQSTIMIGYGLSGAASTNYYTWDYGSSYSKRWGTNSTNGTSQLSYPDSSSPQFSTQVFLMNYHAGDTPYESGYAAGDSGGGTFVKVGTQWELAGINAYVNTSGNNQYTGSYAASVPHYFNWIYRTVFLEGDTNHDDTVDVTDLNNVYNELGSAGSGLPGDTNSDGLVDVIDLNNVYNTLGNRLPVSAASELPSLPDQGVDTGASMAVPDPASITMLAIGGLALLRRRA